MVLLAAGSSLSGDGLSLEGLIGSMEGLLGSMEALVGSLSDGPAADLLELGFELGRRMIRGLRVPNPDEW